ncbi:MAG: hypothetical protein HYZ13_06755 [Acidobacteria bacterium]|nr:hypothetical protein [Acidobacteriota bacterium]
MSKLTILGMLVMGTLARAQGLEIGASFAQQRPALPSGREAAGPGLQLAWDLGEPGRLPTQLTVSYARLTVDATKRDLLGVGLQQAWWSERFDGHALLGLEARVERLEGPRGSVTFGRAWARAGLGFRGILVPLFPWDAAYLLRGNDRFVPFTRIQLAVPLWKRAATPAPPPSWELSLQLGLRLNLD